MGDSRHGARQDDMISLSGWEEGRPSVRHAIGLTSRQLLVLSTAQSDGGQQTLIKQADGLRGEARELSKYLRVSLQITGELSAH